MFYNFDYNVSEGLPVSGMNIFDALLRFSKPLNVCSYFILFGMCQKTSSRKLLRFIASFAYTQHLSLGKISAEIRELQSQKW